MKYAISNLSEAQLRVLSDALDLYLRIRLGQLEEVIDPWLFAKRGDGLEQTAERLELARRLLPEFKYALTGFSSTASWGIGAEDLPDVARVAVDIKDVIRHHLAWERKPEGGHTVDFHEPMHWGSEPLPVVERADKPVVEGGPRTQHKVTVLAFEGFLVMIPHEPEKSVGRWWAPVNDKGNLGSVLVDSKQKLACSREALDLMRTVRRNREAVGDLGWWRCDDGKFAFSWFGALYRIIDPSDCEGDRGFHVHEEQCTIVPNEIPESMREEIRVAVSERRDFWREPFRLERASHV